MKLNLSEIINSKLELSIGYGTLLGINHQSHELLFSYIEGKAAIRLLAYNVITCKHRILKGIPGLLRGFAIGVDHSWILGTHGLSILDAQMNKVEKQIKKGLPDYPMYLTSSSEHLFVSKTNGKMTYAVDKKSQSIKRLTFPATNFVVNGESTRLLSFEFGIFGQLSEKCQIVDTGDIPRLLFPHKSDHGILGIKATKASADKNIPIDDFFVLKPERQILFLSTNQNFNVTESIELQSNPLQLCQDNGGNIWAILQDGIYLFENRQFINIVFENMPAGQYCVHSGIAYCLPHNEFAIISWQLNRDVV
jgi:hypothetical protein